MTLPHPAPVTSVAYDNRQSDTEVRSAYLIFRWIRPDDRLLGYRFCWWHR